MTQEEAMACLKKSKRWLITREVAEKTGMSKSSAVRSLGVLFKHGEVLRKEVKDQYHYTYAWRKRK